MKHAPLILLAAVALAAGCQSVTTPTTSSASTDQPLAHVQIPGDNNINCIALSRDNTMLAAGLADDTAGLWSLPSGKELARLGDAKPPGERFGTHNTMGIHAAAFTPDGRTLATSSNWGTLDAWDLATKSRRWRSTLPEEARVATLTWSPDARLIVIGGSMWRGQNTYESMVMVFAADTGKKLHTFVRQPRLQEGNESGVTRVIVRPDGGLIFGDEDGQIFAWDLQSPQPVRLHTSLGGIEDLVIADSGKHIVWSAACGAVFFLDLTAKDARPIPLPGGLPTPSRLALANDGRHLVGWGGHPHVTVKRWGFWENRYHASSYRDCTFTTGNFLLMVPETHRRGDDVYAWTIIERDTFTCPHRVSVPLFKIKSGGLFGPASAAPGVSK